MSKNNRFSHVKEVILVISLLIAAFALLYYTNATSISFKPFIESNAMAIITSMFVMAVFMERSIEAILIPIRAPDRQKIEQELSELKRTAEADNNKQDIQKKEWDLVRYKLGTAKRAYWLSFGFGLVISIVGIRTLSGLVNPDDLKALSDLHRTFFSFVDIVLTGGVIAGGSAAIDKIGRAISKFFELRSAVDEKPSVNSNS